MKPAHKTYSVIFLLLTALCISSCVRQPRTEDYTPPRKEQAELYLFMQPLPQEMHPLTFTIGDICAVSQDGKIMPLIQGEFHINGRKLVDRQKKLFDTPVKPGNYKGIRFTISRATLAGREGEADLLPPTEPLRVELDFSILRGKAHALFLQLSPEFLVANGFKFTPRFALTNPQNYPKNYLGFVSNADVNLVTVFHKKTMNVVNVIRTGTGPKGMALDQENGIVYVALSGEDAIAAIDADSMEASGRIKLRFGDEPLEIALTPDGETLICANNGSGTVSIIDTDSLSERERLVLDADPVRVVMDRDGRRAYVLHPLPNSISVLNLPYRGQQRSFSLEESPWRGAVNRDSSELYLVSPASTEARAIDTRSLTVTKKIFIGGSASFIAADPKTDLLYIGKNTGEIVVADPSSGIFIDSFSIAGDVDFMAIDGEENMLLVLSSERKRVHKINVVSKNEQSQMMLETGAYALVVMGEL